MHGIFFYIGLGLGLAAACGLRPFLPLLLAGALASSSALGISFSGAPWTFLQEGWWLLVVAIALVLSYAAQILLRLTPTIDQVSARSRPEPFAAALAGIGLGAGAVLFAGTLAAHHDAWWPGLIGGLLAAGLAQRAVGPVISRARLRLPDRPAREALTDLPRRGRPGDGRARVPPVPPGLCGGGAAAVARARRPRPLGGEVRRTEDPAPLSGAA